MKIMPINLRVFPAVLLTLSLSCFCTLEQSGLLATQTSSAQVKDQKPEPPQPDIDDEETAKPAAESNPAKSAPSANASPKQANKDAKPSPPAPPKKPKGPMAKGRVFVDVDGDGVYSVNDQVFSKAKVSDGKTIVETDENGAWELPLKEDSIYFVIKPTGFRYPLDADNLPRFFYVHKPNGSPKLKYPGTKPTGPIPESIDFPLYQQAESENFQIILFGDPQPRNVTEVDYIAHDVIADMIGKTDALFGVTLGDIAFDNLDTLAPLNQAIGKIGIPWHNVIGNHDINLDAKTRKHINESFEANYGPTYYSFDCGQVHFLVLDNIDWMIKDGRGRYTPRFGEEQLKFVEKDLSMIPDTQTLVVLMHVPILSCADHQKLFRLIEDRPLCVSVSAHQHYHKHQFLGEAEGWKGKKEHHHIVNVTVSGSWWSGAKDDRGIPHSTMADGAPNGYSIMTFSENDYQMDFRAAGAPASEQLGIRMPTAIGKEAANVWVNVYNGSEKSTVEMAINDSGDWLTLEQAAEVDPFYARLHKSEQGITPPIEPKLTKPKVSSHLWKGILPADLPEGTHLLRVKSKDMHGRTFYGQRSFRVTGE